MSRFALLALVACSSPTKGTTQPVPAPAPDAAVAAIDARSATQEETLAAIQKALNELDEGSQVCWAIAATERFDIEGDVEMLVDITATGAKTQVMRDTTRNGKLLGCMAELLQKYRWAPPLHGQGVQLPFKFRAPAGQNTIDRNHVTWQGQGKLSIAVLIDENNTANSAVSMIEVALQAGGSTGNRLAERAELWYFLGAATVVHGKKKTQVAAGDMMYVPAQAIRDVQAASDMHAVIVMSPGGREGTARAGALPTREAGDIAGVGAPIFLPAAKAKTHGPATIFAEKATIKDAVLAASIVTLPNGTKIPEHVHAKETELLYVLSGSGTMTVAGVKLAVSPTSVIQIPPNTTHAFTASADVKALQIYSPAGPEQRFKAKP